MCQSTEVKVAIWTSYLSMHSRPHMCVSSALGLLYTVAYKRGSRQYLNHCRSVADYMGVKVTHVLTQENWDENFDQVKL